MRPTLRDRTPAPRQLVRDVVFPRTPGVYVVYEPHPPAERPLYVGVAATQTLCERWCAQHLKNRAGGSALRRTLGVDLALVETKLTHRVGRYYPDDVEQAITDFLESCEIELYSTATADEAEDLEVELRERLQPRLNISRGRRRRRSSRGPTN